MTIFCLFRLFLVLPLLPSNGQIMHCDGDGCNCPDLIDTSSAGICILDCNTADICKGQTLNCRENEPCQIILYSSNSTINANRATDVTIICSAPNSCTQAVKIQCGTGHCVLQCAAQNSCTDLGSIDSSLSTSFECIGECPTALQLQQTVTTSAPTLRLSDNVAVLTVIIICVVMVLLCGYFNCLFYIRINKQLKKYVEQQNTNQIDSRPIGSISPRIPLSPISEEIPQSPTYITRLRAPNMDVPARIEQCYDAQIADIASWIQHNVRNQYTVTPPVYNTNCESYDETHVGTALGEVQKLKIEVDRDDILDIVQKYTNGNDGDTDFDEASISNSESFEMRRDGGDDGYVDMKLYIMKERSCGSQTSMKMYD
eukprot:38306_1